MIVGCAELPIATQTKKAVDLVFTTPLDVVTKMVTFEGSSVAKHDNNYNIMDIGYHVKLHVQRHIMGFHPCGGGGGGGGEPSHPPPPQHLPFFKCIKF